MIDLQKIWLSIKPLRSGIWYEESVDWILQGLQELVVLNWRNCVFRLLATIVHHSDCSHHLIAWNGNDGIIKAPPWTKSGWGCFYYLKCSLLTILLCFDIISWTFSGCFSKALIVETRFSLSHTNSANVSHLCISLKSCSLFLTLV